MVLCHRQINKQLMTRQDYIRANTTLKYHTFLCNLHFAPISRQLSPSIRLYCSTTYMRNPSMYQHKDLQQIRQNTSNPSHLHQHCYPDNRQMHLRTHYCYSNCCHWCYNYNSSYNYYNHQPQPLLLLEIAELSRTAIG